MNFHKANLFRAVTGALLAFALSALNSSAATVSFAMTNSTGPDTNYIVVTPLSTSANADGSYNTRGLPFRIFPNTNGLVSTNLNVGNYLASNAFIIDNWSAPGGVGGNRGVVFAVPASSSNYPFAILAISGYNTYNYTPGVRTITGTNGISVLSLPYGDLVIGATNFSPEFGNKTAAGTNVIAVTNGQVVTVHATVSEARVVAATNGFTSIVLFPTNAFVPAGNPSNWVTASVTNGLGSAAYVSRTNFQSASITLSNLALTSAMTNGLAAGQNITFSTNAGVITIVGPTLTNAQSVTDGSRITLATNGAVVTITAVSQTNNFTSIVISNPAAFTTPAQATNIAATVTNGLGSAAFSNAAAFQPGSLRLTNFAITGGLTNGLAAGSNITFSTNSGVITITGSAGSGGQSVTDGSRITLTTNSGTVTITAVAQTNGFNLSIVTSNASAFTTPAQATNIVTAMTNALGSAAYQPLTIFQPGNANLTNWAGVTTNTIANLVTLTNVANASALNATNGFSSIVISNPAVFLHTNLLPTITNKFAITNDSRVLTLTSTNSLYYGKTTNGINLGRAFSSPGSGDDAEQFGESASATGARSVALGGTAAADGDAAIAIGHNASATEIGVIAIGAISEASGVEAVAIGTNAAASGYRSFALGQATVASEDNAFAIGPGARATNLNSFVFGIGTRSTSSNQIIFGTSTQHVIFPGNGVISGTFTNGNTVLTNLYVDRDITFQWTTNLIWVSGAGSAGVNGTYVWNATHAAYTNHQTGARIVFSNPTWFIHLVSNLYSASTPATNTWTLVDGGNPVPASGFGHYLDLPGQQWLGVINSTNLDVRLSLIQPPSANLTNWSGLSTNEYIRTNFITTFQPGNTTLSNLALVAPNTNRYVGGVNVTLTTNSGNIVTIDALNLLVSSGVSNQWRVDATNAANGAVLGASNVFSTSGFVTQTNYLGFNEGRFPHTLPFLSTNLWQFTTATSNRAFSPILIGDSLIDNKATPLANILAEQFGPAGATFSHSASLSAGASQLTTAYTNWINGSVFSIPNGETATFGGSGFLADTIEVWYQTTNGASTFTVATNIGGGGFSTIDTVNANTGTFGLSRVRIPVGRGIYTVRLTTTSGHVLTPGIGHADRMVGRHAQIYNLQRSGLAWDSFAATLDQVMTNLGVLLPPGPIIIEETSTAALWSAHASNVIERLTRHRPREVIVISPNPFVDSGQETDNLAQIAVMEGLCRTNGWIYFNQHAMWGSARAMTNAGLLDPTGADIHPTTSANYQSVRTMLDFTRLSGAFSGTRNPRYSPPVVLGASSDNDPPTGVHQNSIGRAATWSVFGNPANGMLMDFRGYNNSILGGIYLDSTPQMIFTGAGGGHLVLFNLSTGNAKFTAGVDVVGALRADSATVTNAITAKSRIIVETNTLANIPATATVGGAAEIRNIGGVLHEVLSSHGSTTWTATNRISPSAPVATNWIAGHIYSADQFGLGKPLHVSATIGLNILGGQATSMQLRITGFCTNILGGNTDATGNYTNQLYGYVPAGTTFTFTNVTANAAVVVNGQYHVP